MIKKVSKHIAVLLNKEQRIVKWSKGKYTRRNVGDVLNEYLFPKIFGKEPVNIDTVLNSGFPPVYSFVGSVLDNNAVKNLIVLGSGFKSFSSRLPEKPKKVVACRGPLTRRKLMEAGLDVPEVYGDPAILLPHFYRAKSKKKFKLGIIPHYVDKNVKELENWKKRSDTKILDVHLGVEDFIEDVNSCDFTVSSSLHGIIISHAYGIPSGWLKLSDNLAGGSFKFRDYFGSLDLECHSILLRDSPTIDLLRRKTVLPNTEELALELADNFRRLNI